MASDKKIEAYTLEPTAPITKKGVLMSFLTGEPMSIPDTDLVSNLHYLGHLIISLCNLLTVGEVPVR